MLYFLLLLVIVFLFGIILVFYFKFRYKKSLSKSKIEFFRKKINIISHAPFSKREKILEYDKFYHNILKEAGYNGSFGEILKLSPSQISDINHIWELHKLRNKLAHDMTDISENILNKKAIEFEKELFDLLDKFS